jgi:hypothetical protein
MTKKTIFILLLALCITLPLVAQEAANSSCGTIEKTDEEMERLPWYGNNDFLEQFSTSDSASFLFKKQAGIEERTAGACPEIDGAFLIPIRFWIYRETDNDPDMPDETELQDMMDRLNAIFQGNGLNIRFFMLCPQYETNPDMASASDYDAFMSLFAGANADQYAINVHIVKDYIDAAGVYNSLLDIIIVERSVYNLATGVTTLAHEIGHYFGLEHTHRNYDKGKCRQECVSRTREFEFWGGPVCFKTGKICEKNGDALCDTPADPKLNESGMMNISTCTYTGTGTDNYGDSYTPDVTNIMSYASRVCRSSFSNGQIKVMAHHMFETRDIFRIVDMNVIDPDRYEPDDSDFPGVPREIALGETQCHSFHEFDVFSNDAGDCSDPGDWLIMSLSQGVIGAYQIKIEDVDNDPNPVEKVSIWNIGSDGMRSTELTTAIYSIGSAKIYEFPCSSPNFGSLLIEVVSKPNMKEGKYKITLTSSIRLEILGNNALCQSNPYTIGGLPSGTIATWTSSPNIILQNTSGQTTTIQSIVGGISTYWIEATISLGSCTQIIRRTFTYGGGAGVPNFSIVPEVPACYPSDGEYSISGPVDGIVYEWSCQGSPCDFIIPFGNGESATVVPDGTGTMTLSVTATDGCGNTLTRTRTVIVNKCKDGIESIAITPNPSTGVIDVNVIDSYNTDGTYHILVINQMSELKFQSDNTTKNFSLNLGELQNGVYRILIYRETSSSSANFIINK